MKSIEHCEPNGSPPAFNGAWPNESTVFYHVPIDSFSPPKSQAWNETVDQYDPAFQGGKIKGITDRLSHIVELGADVIYLSPPFRNRESEEAYHGYHAVALDEIDPRFGTEEEFQELIDKTHEAGLKIIVDFVPNHLSTEHPVFKDAITRPNSKFRDWFVFYDWPSGYKGFLGETVDLAKLNLDHEMTMDHLLDAARKLFEKGVDGLRLDHLIGLTNEQIKKFVGTLRAEDPGRVFIGEALLDGIEKQHLDTLGFPNKGTLLDLKLKGNSREAHRRLFDNYVQLGLLDGLLNFRGTDLLEAYALSDSPIAQKQIEQQLREQSESYSAQRFWLLTSMGDQDRQRALFRYGNEIDRLKKTAALLMSLTQPVIIYYGDEVGMTQPQPFSSRTRHSDRLARGRMPWDQPEMNMSLYRFFQELIRERKATFN